MDSTLEQLARYVSQQLQHGIPEQNIRASLAQNRWTQDWIDAVFNVVRQNPNMFAPEQPIQPSTPVAPMDPIRTAQPAFNPTTTYATTAQPTQAQPLIQTPASKSKKTLWVAIISVAVLLVIASGAFVLFRSLSERQGANDDNTSQEEDQKPKTPDEKRKADLNVLLSDLADFFVTNGFYPTYDQLKGPQFVEQNPTFDTKAFADPKWSADNTACTQAGKAIMATRPTEKCYSYSVLSPEGAACDNEKVFCMRMTVVTILDDGKPYAVTLERNTEIEN